MDRGLREVFMAERFTERVIAIKTHEPVNKLTKLKFDRVILLIRDPFDALLSEYNLGVTMSHTNIPSKEKFNNECKLIDCLMFNVFFSIIVIVWRGSALIYVSQDFFNQYSSQYSFQASGCFPT